ncbi:hypothetical protein Esti_005018 [Eimeria stiedai]
MVTLEPAVVPPAAFAAARRLGSSRPLYAVSLSTALSQLLLPLTAHPGSITTKPTWGASCPEGLRPEDGHGGNAEAVLPTEVCSPQEGGGRRGENSSSASMGQWLTGQFVAQVGAHLEAALHESNPSESDSRGCSSECGSAEASHAEAEDVRRYTQAVSRAALQWGLLLLLAVEHLLYRQRSPDTHLPLQPKSPPEVSRCEAKEAMDSQNSITSMHAVDSSSGIAAPADSVIREALAAFEVVFRVSPAVATRVLPNIVAWLDAGLLALVEEPKAVRPSPPNVIQLGEEQRPEQEVYHDAGWDPAVLVSQLLPGARLSALVTSSLGDCHASGPLRKPVEHLQRTRLLGLLLRGPRVLRCSARLLAACAVPAVRSDGGVANSELSWMPGTVPQHTQEQDTSEAASNVEAEVQQRLGSQTAKVICFAIQNLKDALVPSVHRAAFDCVERLAPQASLRFPERIEKTLLTAFLPSCLRWLPSSGMGPSLDATEPPLPVIEGTPSEEPNAWVFACKSVEVTNETLRKVALQILQSTKASYDLRILALLLSFALRIEGSPLCKRTSGVLAAAAENSVVEQARALLKQTDDFFVSVANPSSSATRLELPLAARVHCVTRLSSLALTAKRLPKAFQINPGRADSRILLTAGAAAAVAQLQIEAGGDDRIPRCPLTGRLNLPQGLPDEQAGSHSSHQLLGIPSEEHEAATVGIFAYLNDEGAFRMAAQVARILISLVRDITFEGRERAVGLIVPPLLRILDIPQSEVRFLGWKCLRDFVKRCPRGGESFSSMALMSGFPVFNEVDTCFDAYLEAYTTAACGLCDGPCDQLLLQCQEFLLDMSHPILSGRGFFLSTFLKQTRPLVDLAGDSVNLRLYDWISICLEALQAASIESKLEGLRTLQQLMTVGMDLQEFVAQILCHAAIAAILTEDHVALTGKTIENDKFLELSVSVKVLMRQLASSLSKQQLDSAIDEVFGCFWQLRMEDPACVDRLTRWLTKLGNEGLERHCMVTIAP